VLIQANEMPCMCICILLSFLSLLRPGWPTPMRRKPSEPMFGLAENRAQLEIPPNHALNSLPDAPRRSPPSSLIENVNKT